MQKLIITGNLGADSEIKNRNDGSKFVSFSVAVSESWKDAKGVKQQRTTWYNCFTDNENLAPYLKRGTKVLVEGKPQARGWLDKSTGEVCSAISIRVGQMELLSSSQDKPAGKKNEVVEDDDLPF